MKRSKVISKNLLELNDIVKIYKTIAAIKDEKLVVELDRIEKKISRLVPSGNKEFDKIIEDYLIGNKDTYFRQEHYKYLHKYQYLDKTKNLLVEEIGYKNTIHKLKQSYPNYYSFFAKEFDAFFSKLLSESQEKQTIKWKKRLLQSLFAKNSYALMDSQLASIIESDNFVSKDEFTKKIYLSQISSSFNIINIVFDFIKLSDLKLLKQIEEQSANYNSINNEYLVLVHKYKSAKTSKKLNRNHNIDIILHNEPNYINAIISLAEECRFHYSSNINYTKLGSYFGIDHKTAKKWYQKAKAKIRPLPI